jgi:hypothetical protein
MKQTILFLIITLFLSCQAKQEEAATPQKNPAADANPSLQSVTDALALWDKAYKEDNDEVFKNFLSKDIIVYGTDPSEAWAYDVFKNHIPDTKAQGLPKLKLEKHNSTHMSKDGSSVCVVREISYKPIFENNLRQTLYLEKDGDKWMVKMIALGHLMKNK